MGKFEFREGRGGMSRAIPIKDPIKEAGSSVGENGLVHWDGRTELEPSLLAEKLNRTSAGRAVQAFITRLDEQLVTVSFDWEEAGRLHEDLARTSSYNEKELAAVWMKIDRAVRKG